MSASPLLKFINEEAIQRREDAQAKLRIEGEALDVSALPSFGFGHRSILWWATQCLIAIEGTVFALAVATYFYLRSQSPVWPPTEPLPDLTFGTLNTVILLASVWPNRLTKRAAERLDRDDAKLGLVACTMLTLVFLVVRAFEFATLNCRWDGSAYGSIVWMLLGLHTVHLLTDAYDTIVLMVIAFTGPWEGRRFVDISENALYWYFVVFAWLPIYAVIYWAPRWLR